MKTFLFNESLLMTAMINIIQNYSETLTFRGSEKVKIFEI